MKNGLLFLGILFPVSVFAHGEEVLVSLFYDLLIVIALTVFISGIKWKSNGKLLLAIVLVISTVAAVVITDSIPYTANRALIDTIHIGTPLVSVLGTFLIFRRKFSKK